MPQNQDIFQDPFLQEFLDAKAILKGHFTLSSGLHSDTYLQCARVLMNGARSERLCKALAQKVNDKMKVNFADIVVSPAMGGVVVGYEIAKQLGIPAIFCERVEGKFQFRRGFTIPKNAKVLVVEDVITTGKSSLETFECIQKMGGEIVAEACLVDRSNYDNISEKLGVPVISLIKLGVKVFSPDKIPSELKNIPAIKPGSRFIKK
ncbi:MAG: orotate phosphoribosyltransferase [Rickettsiales bacterium]|jgi:orotate phosphoribosyltransferase